MLIYIDTPFLLHKWQRKYYLYFSYPERWRYYNRSDWAEICWCHHVDSYG